MLPSNVQIHPEELIGHIAKHIHYLKNDLEIHP